MKGAIMFEVDGSALRELRERALLSQRELAEIAGLTQSTLSRLERGKQSARGKTVRDLARALDVEPHRILVQGQNSGGQVETRPPREEPHP
jgi:transcriptional regulator with XRE-family HTH domain